MLRGAQQIGLGAAPVLVEPVGVHVCRCWVARFRAHLGDQHTLCGIIDRRSLERALVTHRIERRAKRLGWLCVRRDERLARRLLEALQEVLAIRRSGCEPVDPIQVERERRIWDELLRARREALKP